MNDDSLIPIPKAWCKVVSEILRNGDENFIDWTHQSWLDWEATFSNEKDAWNYVRFDAMASALEQPNVMGKSVQMRESGETYAFWFYHDSVQMYGKINLRPDGKIILIYSSHSPRKGKENL